MKEFCATVYILKKEKILLIYHKKLKKWLPPGGHIEDDETPPECAIREAFEETGYEIELISQENVWIENNWNANSFQRPFMCLLEEIPECNGVAAHQHIDFIYIGTPRGGKMLHNQKETEDIKWFTKDEISMLKPDVEIFTETLRSLNIIFQMDIPTLEEIT